MMHENFSFGQFMGRNIENFEFNYISLIFGFHLLGLKEVFGAKYTE